MSDYRGGDHWNGDYDPPAENRRNHSQNNGGPYGGFYASDDPQDPYGYNPIPPEHNPAPHSRQRISAYNPYKRPIRYNANVIGSGLLLCFALLLILPFAFGLVIGLMGFESIPEIVLGILELLISITSYVGPLIVIIVLTGIPLKAAFPMRAPKIGLTVPAIFCCLGVSVVGVYASAILSGLLTLFFGIAPSMPDILSAPVGAPETMLYFFSIAVVPAVFEELLFRGAVLQTLRRFGDGFAVVVSAILFACAHGNLVQGPNALVMGLVLGYFVLRTGSVLTGIVMHYVNNGIACLVGLADSRLPANQAEFLNAAIFPFYLSLCAVGVVWILAAEGGFLRLACPDYPLHEADKYKMFFSSGLIIIYLIITVVITVRYITVV